MAGQSETVYGDGLFDPFSEAEATAEEVLQEVLTEGGKLLYDHYIAEKSFSFAAESICAALVAEMKMCFVRYDDGEYRQNKEAAEARSLHHSRTVHALRPAAAESIVRPHSSMDGDSAASPGAASLDVPRPGSAPASTDVERSCIATDGNAGADLARPLSRESEQADSRGHEEQVGGAKAGWVMESEPPRCRIDTWARARVPIRKKLVRPQTLADVAKDPRRTDRAGSSKRSQSRASSGTVSVSGSRSPSRFGNPTSPVPEGAEARGISLPPSKAQQIPIIDEREEDEEETMLRELKDREARKVRDEQMRTERKAAAEMEEAARLAQVKDHEKNKQFTYDTDGNIIWVQPLAVNKLPSTNPAPTFTCKEEDLGSSPPQPAANADAKPPAAPARAPRSNAEGRSKKKHATVEFKDGFKKFPSQQPAMMDAMAMAPGVELQERGKSKKNENKLSANTNMSRKDYDEMLKKSGGFGRGSPQVASPPGKQPSAPELPRPGDASALGSAAKLPIPEEASAAADRSEVSAQVSPRQGPAPGETMKVVRSEMGAELVPRAPAAPRPVQPAPPQIARRMQSKRDALGYSLSTRERVQTGYGGSRYPGGTAQPPVGATMGHGLAPSDKKYEEYFFPNAVPALGLGGVLEELGEGHVQRLSPLAPLKMQGQIVSKNPQLKSRLFGKA
eukprot:TRINITY_DN592_c0_g2_i3.p1 TRINITY_DN592_c0_g2~~TRINITY_DN592_c0_g2_i3.p1  ORF type:complete len:677 (-),score=159.95 TRINITY_DN592_c0_g2_i3:66-2096(-)